MKQSLPVIVAVSGVKNSGKTTFLERVIPLLGAKGLRLGVIKHDGHGFVPDVPGTDSFRLRAAGASSVAVYSGSQVMVSRTQQGAAPGALVPLLGPVDLVLLEGGKATPYPKIELVRAGVSSAPVCEAATLLAVCTDTGCQSDDGVPVLGLEDYSAAAEIIFGYYTNFR